MSYETVIWEQEGGVGRITLNRPDTLNAWNSQFGRDLSAVVELAAGDESVRAVLVTGAGRGFSSGADLKGGFDQEFVSDDGGPDIERRLHELYHPPLTGIRTMPKPVVAAVNGPAAGIGCSLALACDLVVAAESSMFQLAFARVGLFPDGGSTAFVPARVGIGRALQMAMLAERVSASEALQWGLINKVAPDESLMDEAAALAQALSKGPTRSYAASKKALNQMVFGNLEAQLATEAELQHGLARTSDFLEGGMAFLEKREPNFTGR